jgi:hypothetical protein
MKPVGCFNVSCMAEMKESCERCNHIGIQGENERQGIGIRILCDYEFVFRAVDRMARMVLAYCWVVQRRKWVAERQRLGSTHHSLASFATALAAL